MWALRVLRLAGGAVILAAMLGACASLGRRTPDTTARTDTVFYVSARARAEGRDTRDLAAGALEYGIAVLRRRHPPPDDAESGHTIVDSVTLDSATFIAHLREAVARQSAPFDFAMFYVHGMGTSLHEAWQHTAAARLLAGRPVPWLVFCWPATGPGVSWPSSGQIVTAAYRRDSVMADHVRPLFVQTLSAVIAGLTSREVVVASHSLGAQVVGEALHADRQIHARLSDEPLRALVFMLPDLEAGRFRDTIAPSMASLAERRVVYVSRRDRVLTMARLTGNAERAGLRRREAGAPPDSTVMETVDVSNAMTTERWFQQRFGTHHALKRQEGLLFDVVQVVGARRAPSCRELVQSATRTAAGVFELRRVRVVSDSVLACPMLGEVAR